MWVGPGSCCAVCGEADLVMLAPEQLGEQSEPVILCRNDAARARRRAGLTVDELRRELAARSRVAAA